MALSNEIDLPVAFTDVDRVPCIFWFHGSAPLSPIGNFPFPAFEEFLSNSYAKRKRFE